MKKFKLILNLTFTAVLCMTLGAVIGGSSFIYIGAILLAGSIIVSFAMPQKDMAYTICGNIAKSIAPECAYPLVGGLEVQVYLANKGDIAGYTEVVGNPLIVSGLTMATIWTVPYTALSGTFAIGEIITGGTSTAKGVVLTDDGTTMIISVTSGSFTGGETITGDSTGASATATSFTSSAAKFYTYEGLKTSQEAKSTVAKGKYTTNFDHEVDLIVFNVDGATKKELDRMARGVLVAIVEYKYKGKNGSAAFEILGLDQGLEVVKLDRDSASKDTEGAYQLQLKTLAGFSEPHLPRTFFDTDYSTTLAAVKALL